MAWNGRSWKTIRTPSGINQSGTSVPGEKAKGDAHNRPNPVDLLEPEGEQPHVHAHQRSDHESQAEAQQVEQSIQRYRWIERANDHADRHHDDEER